MEAQMDRVGSYEAKTHLSRLLERVAKGEEITITKHGTPIAMLVPVTRFRRLNVKKTIKALEEFGKRHSLGGLSIREMVEEGRE
jgi:prevent-host-death family protein